MKKIFSVILTLAMLLGLCCPALADEPSVSVLFPADGTTITNEQCEVSVEASSAHEIVYEFDGEIIDSPVLTPEMLTIGDHELCVYAISENGSVSSAKSEFAVQKSIKNVRISSDLSGAESVDLTADNPYVYSADSSNATAIRMMRQASKSHGAVLSIVDGPEGEGDVAVKTVSPAKFSNSRPYFNIAYGNKKIETTAVIEHDIMMLDTTTTLQYELKGSDNASWYPVDVKTYPMAGGKFFTSSYTYEANVWYRIKTVLDFDKRTVNMYVTENGSDEVMHVLVDGAMMATGIDLASVRTTYFCGVAGGGYAIDNISVREEVSYTGIEDVKFLYGDEVFEDAYPDSENLTAVKIALNEKVVTTDLGGLVTVKDADGKAVELSSVATDSDGAIVANLASSLEPNTEYSVNVALGAVYPGTYPDTDIMQTKFKTAADSYDVNSVGFSVDGTKLITKNQLSGKKLKCLINLSNSGSEDENLLVVLAVRNGDRLAGLSVANVTVPSGSSESLAEAETAILPETMEDVTVQVMFVDSLGTRKPVFSTYEIKY